MSAAGLLAQAWADSPTALFPVQHQALSHDQYCGSSHAIAQVSISALSTS